MVYNTLYIVHGVWYMVCAMWYVVYGIAQDCTELNRILQLSDTALHGISYIAACCIVWYGIILCSLGPGDAKLPSMLRLRPCSQRRGYYY